MFLPPKRKYWENMKKILRKYEENIEKIWRKYWENMKKILRKYEENIEKMMIIQIRVPSFLQSFLPSLYDPRYFVPHKLCELVSVNRGARWDGVQEAQLLQRLLDEDLGCEGFYGRKPIHADSNLVQEKITIRLNSHLSFFL